jgi:hypothetical protein
MHEATRRILSVLLRKIEGFEKGGKTIVIGGKGCLFYDPFAPILVVAYTSLHIHTHLTWSWSQTLVTHTTNIQTYTHTHTHALSSFLASPMYACLFTCGAAPCSSSITGTH